MQGIEVGELAARVEDLAGQKLLAACFLRHRDAPSDALLAAMEDLPVELANRVEAVRIDIDADADAAALDELRVFKVPELILYADGRIVERTEGAMDAQQAAELLEYVLDSMVSPS